MITSICRWIARDMMGRVQAHPGITAREEACALVMLFMVCVMGATVFMGDASGDFVRGWQSHWLGLIIDGALVGIFMLPLGGFGEMLIERLAVAEKE